MRCFRNCRSWSRGDDGGELHRAHSSLDRGPEGTAYADCTTRGRHAGAEDIERIMREQLAQRLKELHAEFATGQKMLAELEAKQANLRETLLRISGAMQVLEEELARADHTASSNGAEATEERLEVAEQPAPAAHR